MKKNLTLILFGFLPLFALSQIQHTFNYQAAVRNSNGEIQFDTTVNFKIEILQNGNVEYSENHFNKETGKIGVVNFKVGDGEVITGDFSQIDWSQGQLQIRTTLNDEPNPIGTADIVAVPIALYAQNSGDGHWDKQNDDIFYNQGNVGIGTNDPQGKLSVNSNGELIRLNGSNHAYISFYQHPNNTERSGYLGYGASSNNNFYLVNDQDGSMVFRTSNITRMIISESGNIGVGITTPDSKLHVNGRTKTTCLEITGGCDIKEDLNSIEILESGDIVVIDKNNPGQIRRTNQEYDRKVAGIISGANGIIPGISLSQDDVLEGEYPLTMVGRVYVKVKGKVEIGDMLTTSSKPGHAMSVKDYSKAHGTVIGKAMTGNVNEEGMVLVLVNLQ